MKFLGDIVIVGLIPELSTARGIGVVIFTGSEVSLTVTVSVGQFVNLGLSLSVIKEKLSHADEKLSPILLISSSKLSS